MLSFRGTDLRRQGSNLTPHGALPSAVHKHSTPPQVMGSIEGLAVDVRTAGLTLGGHILYTIST